MALSRGESTSDGWRTKLGQRFGSDDCAPRRSRPPLERRGKGAGRAREFPVWETRGCQGSPKSPHFQGRTPCVESITATICRACLGQSSLTVDQLQVGQIGKMPQDLVVAGSHLTPNSPGRQCAAKLATDGSGAAPAASDPRPVSSIGLRFAAIRTDRRPRLRDREPGARPSLGGDQMLRSRRL